MKIVCPHALYFPDKCKTDNKGIKCQHVRGPCVGDILPISTSTAACRQERSVSSGVSNSVNSSPLAPEGQQRLALPQYSQQLGGLPAQAPMYYMQPPQMYYPPSAYAYPGGMMMNAPSKEQVEEAVQKQACPTLKAQQQPCLPYFVCFPPLPFAFASARHETSEEEEMVGCL